MDMNTQTGKQLSIYSLGIGALYLIFGLLEFLRGLSETFGIQSTLSETSTTLIYPDMFSGVTLTIIGLIFLFGVRSQWKDSKDFAPYLVVGVLLSAVFFAVYLVILGAHAVGSAVFQFAPEAYADLFADWADWSWLNDMRPGIWLFAFALPGVFYTLKIWLSRKKVQ
jgi:hypothetical protein